MRYVKLVIYAEVMILCTCSQLNITSACILVCRLLTYAWPYEHHLDSMCAAKTIKFVFYPDLGLLQVMFLS